MKAYAIITVITGYFLLSVGMSALDNAAMKTCERKQEIEKAVNPAYYNPNACDVLLVK